MDVLSLADFLDTQFQHDRIGPELQVGLMFCFKLAVSQSFCLSLCLKVLTRLMDGCVVRHATNTCS